MYKEYIKNCFWIFVFLLLTEGIFRRWLFPSLNNLFLIARDPFVLYVIFLGVKSGLLQDFPAKIMMCLSVLCFLSALLFGHGNIVVALFGMRILLYFPFIYITARVLSREDILKVGRVFVLLIVPMTILCMVQFVSPQSSFVNIGVGGDEGGAGFRGALGYFRPPGIFTFAAALGDYYSVALSFLLYFLMNKADAQKMGIARYVLILSLVFYVISIPVSISRTHLVRSVFILLFFLAIVIANGKSEYKRVFLTVLFVLALVGGMLLLVPDINLYSEVFMARFTDANTSEGGLAASAYERTVGWAIRAWNKTPLMGFGDGHFTNVGMKILHGGVDNYSGEIAVIADSTEMEWGRVLCEDGIILGSCILLMRFYISVCLFLLARHIYIASGDQLAWLLLPFAIYQLDICQLKVPYHLGFTAVIVIVCLAAIRNYQKKVFIEEIKNKL